MKSAAQERRFCQRCFRVLLLNGVFAAIRGVSTTVSTAPCARLFNHQRVVVGWDEVRTDDHRLLELPK